ncbi:MAG TPA: cyclic nucleotide-binding domain-containing protein [Thermoanaerobaculia bacterium]|nr:cyclic nucleotide-binding domain-containing protein [Thermoanaerobaculia bacterium]
MNLFPEQSDHPLFRYFDDGERTLVEAIGLVIELDDGAILAKAGQRDTRLFTVEQGVIEIVAPNGRVLATVGTGDVIGEISFVDESPRLATMRAAEPSLVRAWERSSLLDALKDEPATLAKFTTALCQLLVERLRDTAKAGVAPRN